MSELSPTYLDLFDNWTHLNFSEEQIKEELLRKGYIEEKIFEILTLYKEKKSAARSTKGFILMVVGALIGFTSCMLTLLNVMPEMRDFFMVGLTTIAISIVVLGCYYVFE
ncbi:MAG: hypothetical protein IPJ31_14460 [Bacteroidetes bacterium]|nr:hypothetical protein [Bacteroidota bacterium]